MTSNSTIDCSVGVFSTISVCSIRVVYHNFVYTTVFILGQLGGTYPPKILDSPPKVESDLVIAMQHQFN